MNGAAAALGTNTRIPKANRISVMVSNHDFLLVRDPVPPEMRRRVSKDALKGQTSGRSI